MLYYTDHAKDRMRERGIKVEEVEYCLANYDKSFPCENDDDKRSYVCDTPEGRKIRVVVDDKRSNHKVIISVMEYGGRSDENQI